MKDKELYDFFRERKQVFDETPGDVLWSKIETGLADNTPVATPPESPFLRTLLYSVIVITGIAAIWFALSGQEDKTIPETEQVIIPDDGGPKVADEVTIVDEDGFSGRALVKDLVKKEELHGLQKEVPVQEKLPAAILPSDSEKFDITTEPAYVKNIPGYKTVRQMLTPAELFTIAEKDSVLKPGKAKIAPTGKESLLPQLEFFLVEPIHYQKEKEKSDKKAAPEKRGNRKTTGYDGIIIVPKDSVGR